MANELFHDIVIPGKKKKCPFVSIKWWSSVVAESKVKNKTKHPGVRFLLIQH